MSKVQRLSEEAVRQIAAGEVVERPSSIVKELLENSLDAGSSRITLEIEAGGKNLIRVSDDGCGMNPEDALLALERHTTSKITSFADLEKLSTFGFRGEALPSIASVSKMTLTTREPGASTAFQIRSEGTRLLGQSECGRDAGTTIEVRDLFFNVPARLKFMKSDSSEKGRIFRTFEEIAAANPQVAFELRSDGKKSQELPARKNPLDRIRDLWGEEFNESTLIPLSYAHPYVTITGWVSHPSAHQSTKNYQLLYVNRRPIVSKFIHHALYEAYRDCMPVGRHPAAVLFFELNPSTIDINAHPSKREVKFKDEGPIYQCLVREIRQKRTSLSESPGVFAPAITAAPMRDPEPLFRGVSVPARSFISQSPSALATAPRTFEFQTPTTTVLCQFDSLYIVAERNKDLLLVDQHAAAERVKYEKLKNEMLTAGKIPSQGLLIPYLWNVTLPQAESVRRKINEFKNLGYEIQEFGERTFRITDMPAEIHESAIPELLDEILNTLDQEKDPQNFIEAQIIRTACRTSVKANDRLTNQELSKILNDLEKCGNPHTCPHGRPTTLTLTRAELDKKFGRNY